MNKLSFYERLTATVVFFATIVLILGLGAIFGLKSAKLMLDLLLNFPPVFFVVFCMLYFLSPTLYSLFGFKKQNNNTQSFFIHSKLLYFY